MDLVTVTCDRDLNAMILQAESIQKFLNPCTHWVIVNEYNTDLSKWYKLLSPFYTNHILKLLPRVYELDKDYSNIDPRWGWRSQQLQKLYISTLLDDDYLILDSHNFFIKSTNLEEFRKIIGSGTIQRLDDSKFNHSRHQRLIEKYIKMLGIDRPEYVLCDFTPFTINLEIIRNFKDFDNLYNYLIPSPYVNTATETTSEFILYSMLIPNLMNNFKEEVKWHSLWNLPIKQDYILSDEEKSNLNKAISNPDIKLLKIHSSVIDNINDSGRNLLNNLLQNLSLTFKF
jgi:Family of unknown function (DUF6492)